MDVVEVSLSISVDEVSKSSSSRTKEEGLNGEAENVYSQHLALRSANELHVLPPKETNELHLKKLAESIFKQSQESNTNSHVDGEQFSEIVGSPYYMALEVLMQNYGPEVDIWSSGVILYILLCEVPPFCAETEQDVARAILISRGILGRRCLRVLSLVRQMLDSDPRKGLTAKFNSGLIIENLMKVMMRKMKVTGMKNLFPMLK